MLSRFLREVEESWCMAKRRPNLIPIIEDARNPAKYKMLVSMVDVICADLAQPDEVLSY